MMRRKWVLSPRQREVLNLLFKHDANEELVLKEMGIARTTFNAHLAEAYKRLKVNNLIAAVVRATELGLINFQEIS